MAGGSTAFYLAFLNEQRKDPSKPVIPSLRLLNGGGAPKPPEVFREVRAEMHIPICHGYGMTECPMITQGSIDDDDEQLANTDGAPVFGCEVQVVGEDGNAGSGGRDRRGARPRPDGRQGLHRSRAVRRVVRRRRVLHHRRPRLPARRRPPRPHRAQQGDDHPQGREHQPARDRRPAADPSEGRGRRRDRPARP